MYRVITIFVEFRAGGKVVGGCECGRRRRGGADAFRTASRRAVQCVRLRLISHTYNGYIYLIASAFDSLCVRLQVTAHMLFCLACI